MSCQCIVSDTSWKAIICTNLGHLGDRINIEIVILFASKLRELER